MTYHYLEEALEQYGMQSAAAELIRHNENMTFRVAGKYLLRIHKHKEGFHTGPIYDGLDRVAIYREELGFLTFLHGHGLDVQLPCPNKDGGLVTLLPDGTAATMLTWLPGRIPKKAELEPDLCFRIGEMVGRLHKAARTAPKIPVLQYDDALCRRLAHKFNESRKNPIWGGEHIQNMLDAADTIARELYASKEESILVHADLSSSNLLITDAGLVPIDFSLFGYCHPMMDLSSLFCNINGLENRRAMAAGYLAEGGTIHLKMLDCCFALNILLTILLHCDCWPKEDWFSPRLARWCREVFVPLANGEDLFSDDFYLLHAK